MSRPPLDHTGTNSLELSGSHPQLTLSLNVVRWLKTEEMEARPLVCEWREEDDSGV